MTEQQVYALLKIVHLMILKTRNGEPITTTDLIEWSRQVAF